MNPNLFKYATSELSQDAFICWLLEWANPENENEDRGLHKIGTLLIDEFFRLADIEKPFKYTSVVIKPQHKNIDILCVVNEEYAIIIEDKTYTSEHHDQLSKYYKIIENSFKKYKSIIPIYFKTGEQNSYKTAEEANFKLFLRKGFLEILDKGDELNITNSIFRDYYFHLKDIEKKYNSYSNLPTNKWVDDYYGYCWVGFFKELKERINKKANWEYISNPRGGFYSLRWGWKNIDGGEFYIQIEEKKLCFKIYVYKGFDRSDKRWEYHLKAIDIAAQKGIELVKPKRFGNGEYMTVAILKDQYLVENEFGLIDLDKTVLNLQRMEKLIDKIE